MRIENNNIPFQSKIKNLENENLHGIIISGYQKGIQDKYNINQIRIG